MAKKGLPARTSRDGVWSAQGIAAVVGIVVIVGTLWLIRAVIAGMLEALGGIFGG